MSEHVSHRTRVLLFLALVMCTVATFGYGLYKRENISDGSNDLMLRVRSAGTAFVSSVEHQAESVIPSKPKSTSANTNKAATKKKEVCGCTKHQVRFKRDHYDHHRLHAQKLNNSTILTDKMIHSSNSLVKVNDGAGYRIDRYKLTHSHAYLNRYAYNVLQEMGNAYAQKVKGTKAEGSAFHISSLSRTKEQQKKLSRSAIGRNATLKESAHSYGASFDIYKLDNTNSCTESRKAFEEVLKDFQKRKKILLCPEGNCIHVTVRK